MLKSAFFLTTLFLFLFLDNLNATNYYIDRDAVYSETALTGLSWTNAAQSIYKLFNLTTYYAHPPRGGDTIYFSGGTDSTLYDNYVGGYPNYNNFTITATGNPVVITKGWETGHNGDVYFTQKTGGGTASLDVGYCSNVKLVNLKIITQLTGIDCQVALNLDHCSNVIVDSCQIISNGSGNAIGMGYCDHITISNCTITVSDNTLGYGQDNIHMGFCAGGNTFINNKIYNYGHGGVAHNDLIQNGYGGSTSILQTTIANNLFYYNIPNTSGGGGGGGHIYISGSQGDRYLIYNNIFVSYIDVGQLAICMYKDISHGVSTPYLSARIYNNTFISHGVHAGGIKVGDDQSFYPTIDTLIIKNNIIEQDSLVSTSYDSPAITFNETDFATIPYVDIDYNHYYTPNVPIMFDSKNSHYTWTQWKTKHGANGSLFDTHSDTGVVSFANKWGTNAADYKLVNGSAGVNTGVDLSDIIPAMDILGTKRPIGAGWDMGAFQFSSGAGGGGGTLPTSTLNLTALIEALYVAGGTAMPISPWVTVELHNSTAPYALVDSNSAALNPAGDGIFTFTKAVSGTNYYIVVKSMNTIETWSASPHSFISSALSYNFTTAITQAYTDGSNPPLALHKGKYCIYSGDLNQDGIVAGDDFTGVDNDGSTFNYHPVNDLNGDGLVTAADVQFINKNNLLFIYRQAPAGVQ